MAANPRFRRRRGFHVPADLPEVPNHPVEGKENPYNRIIIPLVRTLLKAQGVRLTVFGAENIPVDGPALLAVNHTGYYDFIFGGIPAHLRGRRLQAGAVGVGHRGRVRPLQRHIHHGRSPVGVDHALDELVEG